MRINPMLIAERLMTRSVLPPVVSETSVGSDLLKSLKVLTKLVVKTVGRDLRVLAVLVVLLSVEEPIGNLVLTWIRNDRDNSINLYKIHLTKKLN